MAEINPTAVNATNPNSALSSAASSAEPGFAADFWGEDGFSFGDILDLINPLQHLPIIGTLYRAATGDEISTGSSILGGGLFGGIIGAGAAVVNTIIEEATGGEIGDHILALFGAGEPSPADDAPAPVIDDASVLASAESHDGYGAAFGRRAQEATWSDLASREPAAASPASAEYIYAFNPAQGRRDQEVTMTSLASTMSMPAGSAPAGATPGHANPGDAAPALAARPTAEPTIGPVAENQAPPAPIWLTATPRAESGVTAAAMRYMTPQAGLQLVQAIDLYNDRTAAAAKAMTTEPGLVDNLY